MHLIFTGVFDTFSGKISFPSPDLPEKLPETDMPRKNIAGSFEGAPNYRWVRMVKGKRWRVLCRSQRPDETAKPFTGYLNLPESQWSQTASQAAANAWWENHFDQLSKPTVPPEKQEAIADIERKITWAKHNKPDEVERLVQTRLEILKADPDDVPHEDQREIDENLGIAELMGITVPADTDPIVLSMQFGRGALWQQRFANSAATPTDKTMAAATKRFLMQPLEDVKASKASTGGFDNKRRWLSKFTEFVGDHVSVESITTELIDKWKRHVTSKVYFDGKRDDKRNWSDRYANDILQTSKAFVTWLWKRDEIKSIPKNIDELRLSVQDPPEIITYTNAEIRKLLKGATGQLKLHLLLMLNCGHTQKDISDLTKDQINWKRGLITRKRSKTRGKRNVPVVEYKLWKCTLEELKLHLSSDPVIALLNREGLRWVRSKIVDNDVDGKLSHTDGIDSNFAHLLKKTKLKKPLKSFRKTSASRLQESENYADLRVLFLGQSNRTVADKYYAAPPNKRLASAIEWLGEQYGLE